MDSFAKTFLSDLLTLQEGGAHLLPDHRRQEQARVPVAIERTPGLTCRRCGGLEFDSISSFRTHFKIVHESGDDENESQTSSSSGKSSSSSSDSDDDAPDEIKPDMPGVTALGAHQVVLLQDTNRLALVWKALLSKEALYEATEGVPLPCRVQDLVHNGACTLTVLYRGGYFAAVVLQVAPQEEEAPSTSADAAGYTGYPRVLLHRRFARYTTRRKQGGSQRAHDSAAGRAAQSIGAQIRRAGEAALIKDIHALWQEPEWRAAIDRCSHLFLSASKTTRRDLFDGEVVQAGDARMRSVPMATQRPTFAEAVRVARAMATFRVGGVYSPDSEITARQAAAAVEKEAEEERAQKKAAKRRKRQDAVAAAEAKISTIEDAAAEAAAEVDVGVEGTSDGVGVAAGAGSKKKGKKRRHKGKRAAKPLLAEASSDDSEGEEAHRGEGVDEETAALQAALDQAEAERWRQARATEARASLAALRGEAVRDIRSFAGRACMPAHTLAAALGASSLDPAFQSAIRPTGGAGGGAGKGHASASITTEEQLQPVRETLDTLMALVSDGIAPCEALSACGWDGLGAASSVACAGMPVDWSQVPLHELHRGRGGSGKGPQAVALQAGAGKSSKKKGKSGARVLDPELSIPAPAPVAVRPTVSAATTSAPLSAAKAAQRPAAPQAVPLASASAAGPARLAPADSQAMAGLDDRDRRRMEVRAAAEARWRVLEEQRRAQGMDGGEGRNAP